MWHIIKMTLKSVEECKLALNKANLLGQLNGYIDKEKFEFIHPLTLG